MIEEIGQQEKNRQMNQQGMQLQKELQQIMTSPQAQLQNPIQSRVVNVIIRCCRCCQKLKGLGGFHYGRGWAPRRRDWAWFGGIQNWHENSLRLSYITHVDGKEVFTMQDYVCTARTKDEFVCTAMHSKHCNRWALRHCNRWWRVLRRRIWFKRIVKLVSWELEVWSSCLFI